MIDLFSMARGVIVVTFRLVLSSCTYVHAAQYLLPGSYSPLSTGVFTLKG